MRRPLVIYDFATAPFWISIYLRKILFSFLSVYYYKIWGNIAIFIIYLSRVLCLSYSCLSSCHPVILSSCHSCGTLSYSLCLSNQTDQGDEREGFEREGYRWRERRWRNWRGRVWIDFSLFQPNLRNMTVHRATCSCSVELYKQWFTLADFLQNWDISRGFLYLSLISSEGSAKLHWKG